MSDTPMRKYRPLLALLLVFATLWIWRGDTAPSGDETPTARFPTEQPTPTSDTLPRFLPEEASETLALIARGGPFPHRQDGGVFGNRERRLPPQPRGHYREYTVATPGREGRGARRIVTGGQPPTDYWYTDDHYESFRHFEVEP